jgi:hypothetical protein
MGSDLHLKLDEIAAAFATEDLRRAFPPILNVPQAALLLGGLSSKTIYLWVAEGRLNGCFRKRGKHILLWRDRLLDRIFNGPTWESKQ